jgi:fibronectin type 3 domain-containing protein
MKRKTTTAQISEALTTNLLTVTRTECYHKTLRQTDNINPESFIEDLQFLCEANVFMDCVGWHYEKDFKTGQYIIEAGRSDAYSENIITIHMRVNEGVKIEDIERALKIEEE